jgi:S-adenosyl-L-methionine hydrolase (adenosine-forming)
MLRPVIALLTDFGTRDHYVAAMKGVALGICPDAALVDVTHDIPPQDVTAAALELAACYSFFPPATVFLVVIDPGVGSARRALAVEAGTFRFVAPDNGVLTAVLEHQAEATVVELRNAQYARPDISHTFEGRDRFAPAAAWLATGVAVSAFGPAVTDAIRIPLARPSREGNTIEGHVVRIDRFGNLITDIPGAMIESLAAAGPIRVEAAAVVLDRVVRTYADVQRGSVCALVGSTGVLEIAVSGGSAADRLGLGRHASVRVRRGGRDGAASGLL